jgi:hypothetical protein
MRMHRLLVIVAGLALPTMACGQDFNLSPTYAGTAVALQVSPWNVDSTVLADTGPAPPTGGQIERSMFNAAPAPGVTAHELYAITLGSGGRNRSQSSLSYLDATVGSHRVTAQWVESEATATAEFFNVPTSGSATVKALTVDGQPVAVTGEANQTITFPDGYLIINEQAGKSTRHFGTLTVNALHLQVDGAGGMIAASSTAEVINSPMPNVGL